MGYQYKREPLTADQATRLANGCTSSEERLVVWTLLDTGLRLRELASLTRQSIDWQGQRVRVHGKGGPYGSRSKGRAVPPTPRLRAPLEPYFALHATPALPPQTLRPPATRAATPA